MVCAGNIRHLRPDGLRPPVCRDAKYQIVTPEWLPFVIYAAWDLPKTVETQRAGTMKLPPSSIATDIDLHCNNLLYHICYGYYSMLFDAFTKNIATSEATESHILCTVLTCLSINTSKAVQQQNISQPLNLTQSTFSGSIDLCCYPFE